MLAPRSRPPFRRQRVTARASVRHRLSVVMATMLLGVSGGLLAQRSDTPAGGGQPSVTFRLDVDYVEVDAVVTDASGNFVRDLSLEDFRILEDGKPQRVETFSLVDLPVPRPAFPASPGTTIEPDVQSNAQPFDGRLYVLILDDYHTVPLRTSRVIAAARLFIEQHLGPDDYTAVIHTSGRPEASQGFTRNKRLLLEAVSRFIGRKTEISSMSPIPVRDRRFKEFARNAVAPTDFERGFRGAGGAGCDRGGGLPPGRHPRTAQGGRAAE